jgi:hypothetical protein
VLNLRHVPNRDFGRHKAAAQRFGASSAVAAAHAVAAVGIGLDQPVDPAAASLALRRETWTSTSWSRLELEPPHFAQQRRARDRSPGRSASRHSSANSRGCSASQRSPGARVAVEQVERQRADLAPPRQAVAAFGHAPGAARARAAHVHGQGVAAARAEQRGALAPQSTPTNRHRRAIGATAARLAAPACRPADLAGRLGDRSIRSAQVPLRGGSQARRSIRKRPRRLPVNEQASHAARAVQGCGPFQAENEPKRSNPRRHSGRSC